MSKHRGRRGLIVALALVPLLALPFLAPGQAGAQGGGGPVLIMGIDAEDGGPGGHGPITVYQNIVSNVLADVNNGGDGLLVFGAGRAPGSDQVSIFYETLAAAIGEPLTLVNGAANIASQSLDGFAVVIAASSEFDTSDGMTDAESEALALRSFDLATFVNNGGGLISFMQGGLTTPYGFLGDLGTFVSDSIQTGSSSDVDVTAEGTTAGLTDELDVCCWHDYFVEFPSFLTVLATYNGSTEVAAIGGADVVIPTGIELTPATQDVVVGGTCAVTATVTENEEPAVGVEVRFSVTAGPATGTTGTATSDANGQATFSFPAAAVGSNTIVAEFTDSRQRVRVAIPVTCNVTQPTTSSSTTPTSTAAPTSGTPRFTG